MTLPSEFQLDAAAIVAESGLVVYDANGDGNDDVVLKRWPFTDANGRIDQRSSIGDFQGNAAEDVLLLATGGGYFETPQVIDHDGDGVTRIEAEPCRSAPGPLFCRRIPDVFARTGCELLAR